MGALACQVSKVLNASAVRRSASFRALTCSMCRLRSRAIVDAPMTAPSSPITGDTVTDTGTMAPSLRRRSVWSALVVLPCATSAIIMASSSGRSSGTRTEISRPIISAAS